VLPAVLDGLQMHWLMDPDSFDLRAQWAVVAGPDPLWGETPCAFVTLRPDVDGAPEEVASELIEWCRGTLARFKTPKRIVFGPLPKTSTGKIQKFLLREQAHGLSQDAVPP